MGVNGPILLCAVFLYLSTLSTSYNMCHSHTHFFHFLPNVHTDERTENSSGNMLKGTLSCNLVSVIEDASPVYPVC